MNARVGIKSGIIRATSKTNAKKRLSSPHYAVYFFENYPARLRAIPHRYCEGNDVYV